MFLNAGTTSVVYLTDMNQESLRNLIIRFAMHLVTFHAYFERPFAHHEFTK